MSIGLAIASFALGAVTATPVAAASPPPPYPAPTRYVVAPAPVHQDVSLPLASMAPGNDDVEHSARGKDRAHKTVPKQVGKAPASAAAGSPSVPSTSAPTSGVNFDGIGVGLGTYSPTSAPPDTNASVGPNHIVETVNQHLAVFNKTGALTYGPVPINTLWNGFGGGCQTNNDGDPTALYDSAADRWLISQFSVSTKPYLNCIAISKTPDPTGSYNRYSYSYGTDFPDYPKFGIWPDAYYVTFNMFANGTTFAGATTCAYDRAKMLTNAAATQQCFNAGSSWSGLLPSTVNGATAPPAGADNYILGLDAPSTSTLLQYWRFHVDWMTSASTTMTGPQPITVASYTNSCASLSRGDCIPEVGGTNLESLADRLMYRLNYRNFGDHEALVVDHTIEVGAGATLHSGVRWYEIRPNALGTLILFQQGTYSPDNSWRWMGSINMDQAGNIAMGYSVSSSTIKPEIHYTGRLVGDPLGAMSQGENVIIDGTGSQTCCDSRGRPLARWGDYSSMAVDTVDDCTFFHANEYLKANGVFNWSTRIASFKLPSCSSDFSISALPTSSVAVQGASTSYTVSTAQTKGSALSVTFSASGLPFAATATFNPTSVPAGSSTTMTVNVGATTPLGTYTLTIQGAQSGGSTHSTTVGLTVISTQAWVAGYNASATPTSWSVKEAKSYSVTVTNLGSQTWSAGGSNPVRLGVHFANTGGGYGSNVWYTDQRFDLAANLAPGASVTLSITVTAPANSGTFVLEYQMVKELQFWFAQFADVTTTVTVPWAATYSVGATPTSWATNQTQTYSVTITNSGSQTWSAGGSNPVRLGVHFANGGGGYGSNIWYTDQRYGLTGDLAPGASVTLSITVTAPAHSGTLVLEYQMVKELQFWFAQFADVAVMVA
jgi:hypothetical protein